MISATGESIISDIHVARAIGAIIDSAEGDAAMTMIESDSDVVPLEYKINFLRPASRWSKAARGGNALRSNKLSSLPFRRLLANR